MFSKALNTNDNISGIIGVLISFFFFIILFYLTLNFTEERLLNEGAKELIAVINKKSFFLLHPERIAMIASQLFPFIGLKIGLDLNSLVYLYSFNLFLITIIVYLIGIYFKDYYLGIFLCAVQIIGIGQNFFLYPFLEPIYAFMYCTLLYYALLEYQRGSKLLIIPIVTLIILSVSCHPFCILYVALLYSQVQIPKKEKLILAIITIIFLLATIIWTEISISQRANKFSISLISERMGMFVCQYPDLIALFFISLVAIVSRKENVLFLLLLFIIGSLPYILYYQLPTYYFLYPTGLSLLLFATSNKLKRNPLIILFIVVLFIHNAQRIYFLGKDNYSVIHQNIVELIQIAQNQGGSKFIILKDDKTAKYFYNTIDFPFDESIKHSSILHSSIPDRANSVLIESYDFNKSVFADTYPNLSILTSEEKEVISFISQLYDNRASNTLYPEYFNYYEYCAYFFTNRYINKRYFGVDLYEKYQILSFKGGEEF